jgi:predicted nucleic acid-binding protein
MEQAAEALVVDASLAVKWHLLDEEHAQEAALLLRRFMQGEIDLVAPTHLRYEVPSAIIVATLGRDPRLTAQQGREAIEDFLALGLRTVNTDTLILAAYPLVHQYGIAFYDALYLALSQQLDLPFITADGKLYQRLSQLPSVIWIGDYAGETGR